MVLWGPVGTSEGVGLGHRWDQHQEQGAPSRRPWGASGQGGGRGSRGDSWTVAAEDRAKAPEGGGARGTSAQESPHHREPRFLRAPLHTAQPVLCGPRARSQSRVRGRMGSLSRVARPLGVTRHRSASPGSPPEPRLSARLACCGAGRPAHLALGCRAPGPGPAAEHRPWASCFACPCLVLTCPRAGRRWAGVRARSPLCAPRSPRGQQAPYVLSGGSASRPRAAS